MTGREGVSLIVWGVGGVFGILLTIHALASLDPSALWDFVMGRP